MLKKTLNSEKPVLIPALLLLLFAGIAFWQIAFLQNSLQWDMLDCYLPWRYFVSDSINHHIFPQWNPYQNLGYPIHADLRSVWAPEVWLVSILGGYTNYTIHYIFMFYIFLAGYGMYRLLLNFKIKVVVALAGGITYMLSGYFVGHAQEMFSIAGGALLPFIILHYLKLLENKKIDDVMATALLLFLMITSGYQALTIILFYLLLSFFVFYLVKSLKEKNYPISYRLIMLNLLLVIFTALMISVLLTTIIQVKPFVARMGGMPLKTALFGPFSPQCLISFFLPFTVVKKTAFFDTDLSMTNAYVGVILLIFFFFSFFRKKSAIEKIFLIFGLICLIASFGRYAPVREFLFRYIPLMNLFRFPSYFIQFTVIAMIISGAKSLDEYLNDSELGKKKLQLMVGMVFFIILTLTIMAMSKINFHESAFLKHQNIVNNSTIYEHIFINGIIQLAFMALFFQLLSKRLLHLNFLVLLIVFDMLVSAQLNAYFTVCSPDTTARHVRKIVNSFTTGYPIPSLDAVASNKDGGLFPSPLWRNTSTFMKKVSVDGFNSFQLKNFQEFEDLYPGLKNAVLKNPIVYFSDKVFPIHQLKTNPSATIDSNALYLEDKLYSEIGVEKLLHHASDRLTIKRFNPGEMIVETKTSSVQCITLMQNNYPGWKVFIDQKETRIFTSNIICISAIIPAGKHLVSFRYFNKPVYVTFILSYLSFLLLFIILITRKIILYKKSSYNTNVVNFRIWK